MLTLDCVKYYYYQDLYEFDLQVEPGSIVALMGPSGAGKSTLFSLVAGFIEPQSGTIEANGIALVGLPPHRRPCAMLFQEHNLFAHLTVEENIGLGLHPNLRLTEQEKEQVRYAAHQVGVDAMLDRLPEQLSGGQRQRVALARCFVQQHPIWLLDEPFSALDPILREEMLTLVKELANERNITVVMVTHHISDARAIATHFTFMSQGKVELTEDIEKLTVNHPYQPLSKFVRAGG